MKFSNWIKLKEARTKKTSAEIDMSNKLGARKPPSNLSNISGSRFSLQLKK